MNRDGTMALCRTCHRACYCWTDRAILFAVEEYNGQDVYFYGSIPAQNEHWTHWVMPKSKHDAMPMITPRDRMLHCTACRQPQEHDDQGWHCTNDHCPTKAEG